MQNTVDWLSVFGAMQTAKRKWRVRRLGIRLGLGLGFVIALRCAICIAPNIESPVDSLFPDTIYVNICMGTAMGIN